MKFYLDTEEFGRIFVFTNRQARNMIARWKNDVLQVTVPVTADAAQVQRFLADHRDALMAIKPDSVQFHIGQVLQCYGCTITITEQDRRPGYITWDPHGTDMKLCVYRGADTGKWRKGISTAIERMLQLKAPQVLIPHAQQVAQRLGVAPREWQIGSGMRKLGHCTQQGVILLSHNLMLLPEELIDFVICHELAHLTHFDHSPAFHQLCNSYLGGREQELTRQLKAFNWPILGR